MIYLRKRVIIDEVEKDNEKVIFKGLVSNKFFEWLLYMVGYAIVLIAVSVMFDNKVFYINNQY